MLKDNEIIGYSRFQSKKGNEVMYVNVAQNLTQRDKEFGHVGMRVEQIWIPSNCFDKFNSTVVGKVLKPTYVISGGRAEVTDVAFV